MPCIECKELSRADIRELIRDMRDTAECNRQQARQTQVQKLQLVLVAEAIVAEHWANRLEAIIL